MSRYEAAKLADLPEVGAVRVDVAGLPVAVVRDAAGDVHAVGDTCTHADVSLAEGEVDDCSIECWLHGSRFDLRTGAPLSLPAIRPVPVYAVTVEDGTVFVEVPDSAGPGAGTAPHGTTATVGTADSEEN